MPPAVSRPDFTRDFGDVLEGKELKGDPGGALRGTGGRGTKRIRTIRAIVPRALNTSASAGRGVVAKKVSAAGTPIFLNASL